MRIFEGKVIGMEIESDNPEYCYFYGEVTNDEEDLTEVLLAEFRDKKVRITIEVIE